MSHHSAVRAGRRRLGHDSARTHHILDVENLAGTPDCSEERMADVAASYERLVAIGPMDQITIGCSHFAAERGALLGWEQSHRLVFGSGPDGADLALIDILDSENIGGRFDHVVIGSGDGIFALWCAKLKAQGVEVTVVARDYTSLSCSTAHVVSDVRFLDDVGGAAPQVAGSPADSLLPGGAGQAAVLVVC